MTALWAAGLLDHHGLDLAAARQVTYRLEQSFRYSYDSPVTNLSQRLVIIPRRRHGDAWRRAHKLAVVGARSRRLTRQDGAGNTVVRVAVDRVEHSVEFRLTALVEAVRRDGFPPLPASALTDLRALSPTRLTEPDDNLRDLASSLGSGAPEELAERVCAAVHERMRYGFGVTTVDTTAAEALAGGVGVCQDAAHVMVSVCHLLGLPAWYVSGHLLGQGGTHAWVEVIVPAGAAARAVAFDPCHGRRTDARYVTVAVGRDYADVAPTSGSYVGPPGSRLTSSRRVGIVNVA